MAKTLDPLLTASFFGPWVPQPGQRQRTRHHYPSLLHWMESAKFMPAHPDLHDAVILCPSLKEARKFAKKRETKWRSDWNLVRHSVMTSGMGFLSIDRPDLDLPGMPKATLAARLAGMEFSERFIQDCVSRFHLWAAGPRIAAHGTQDAPEFVIGRKFSKLVDVKPNWTLVALCNSKASWLVHDWALVRHVPIQYVGTPTSRTTSSLVEQFVTSADQVVVFEARGGRKADTFIQKAKAHKVSLSIELYSQAELKNEDLFG